MKTIETESFKWRGQTVSAESALDRQANQAEVEPLKWRGTKISALDALDRELGASSLKTSARQWRGKTVGETATQGADVKYFCKNTRREQSAQRIFTCQMLTDRAKKRTQKRQRKFAISAGCYSAIAALFLASPLLSNALVPPEVAYKFRAMGESSIRTAYADSGCQKEQSRAKKVSCFEQQLQQYR